MYNITGINGSSLDTAYVGISAAMPSLFPLLLFFEFLVISLTGAFAHKRLIGGTNLPMWFTMGALTTTISALALYMVPGLITSATLTTCISLTFGFAIWWIVATLNPQEE